MVSGISGGPSASQMQQMQKMMRERMQSGGGQAGGQGGMPEIPSGMQSIFNDAMSQGGSMDDVKSRVQSGFADYQKTDEFKNLSDDQRTKLTDLVQNGPPQPPAGFDPSKLFGSASGNDSGSFGASGQSGQSQVDLIKSLLDQLEDKGSSTRAKLNEQASQL
jgi:hypothetical protein